jgi:hypothetical protein
MTTADWINVAICANRRKAYCCGHASWWREHQSERCAIEQAKRASALTIGGAGGE